ncbi:hypothetical protein Pcinc_012370 [Petrolisthes cinctipes]|uniref:PiggyBac transposable element-derived protein domain-containing protein n=1 Tax=Petrolisthes cinctipes TaxID=88211 RepID=A0AAE1FZ87_PETCI|nr:hypothetical protein Pcinc_012370 [Petrolisthes cinctipes]
MVSGWLSPSLAPVVTSPVFKAEMRQCQGCPMLCVWRPGKHKKLADDPDFMVTLNESETDVMVSEDKQASASTKLSEKQARPTTCKELTRSINTNVGEIQKLLAVLLYMGICQLPAIGDYWSVRLRYPFVADVMSSERFKCLRRFIHFHDNYNKDNFDDKFE